MGSNSITSLRHTSPFRQEASLGSQARIVELLVKKYGVEPDKVSPTASMADLGLDSLSVAELVFDIEDLFEIEIPLDDAEFRTFGEAVVLVDRYLGAKGD